MGDTARQGHGTGLTGFVTCGDAKTGIIMSHASECASLFIPSTYAIAHPLWHHPNGKNNICIRSISLRKSALSIYVFANNPGG